MKAKKEEKKKAGKEANTPNEAVADITASSELNESRWSVVTFERRAAGNLTYDQAAEKTKELKAQKIAGLCIVTDETAARISIK